MGNKGEHSSSSGSKKGLSAFEKAFAKARKKAGGPDGIFTFKGEKYHTAYKGEKKPNKPDASSSGVSKTRMEGFEPLGKSKTILELGEAKKRAASRFKDKGAGTGAKGTISLTIIGVGQSDLPKKVEPKPAIRAHVDAIKNQRERRAWEEKFGANYNNDGTLKKSKVSPGSKARKESRDKAKGMNVGGLTQSSMMNGLSRKINPTTGLTMKKGGMIDYRKKGMFYGGGMARRGR